MLDRYKKKGGFSQLLQLLETSPVTKREQFLTLIAGESPAWEEALRKKMLTIGRIYSWDPKYLMEVFSRVPPLTLASALKGNPADQVENLLSCLPPISRRKIVDLMEDTNVTPAEQSTSIAKLLSEVRSFISTGIVRLDKVDPDLLIGENIEDTLNMGGVATSQAELDLAAKGELKPAGVADGNTDVHHELEFLRRKVAQFSSEINGLKQENTVLKDKLAQIKRIA